MQYVIIGAGPCGVVAAETLCREVPSASVTLLGNEPEPPYSRMAIPYYLTNNISEEGTYLRHEAHLADLGVRYLNRQVSSVDPQQRKLLLDDGTQLSYKKLLIATGSHPVSPPIEGIDLPNVLTCWTLENAKHITEYANKGANIVLIGAGFIGSIIMESLMLRGVNLSVVEMGNRMVPRMLDEKAGGLLEKWCSKKGVNVLTSTRVTSIKEISESHLSNDSKRYKLMEVSLDNGENLQADLVISATGVKPNTAFLSGSGIKVNDGILVDNYLQSNIDGIYAAGDVAQGKDFSTGESMVQAIQPTATDHGRIAALNMSGSRVEHHGSLNMNVLDTLGLISHSFGLWKGVEGGDSVEIYDPNAYKYINLRFGIESEEDVLIGASVIGGIQHVGVVRGLIEGKIHLSRWKERLLHNPLRLMEAYISSTQELGNSV